MLNGQKIIDRLRATGESIVLVDRDRQLCLSDGVQYRTYTYTLSLRIGKKHHRVICVTTDLDIVRQELEEQLKGYNYFIPSKDSKEEIEWIVLSGASWRKFKSEEEAKNWLLVNGFDNVRLIRADRSNSWLY